MKTPFNPVRLLVEILLTMVAAQSLIMLLVPALRLPATGLAGALVDAALLVLFCAPVLFWRVLEAAQRAKVARGSQQATSIGFRNAVVVTLAAYAVGMAITIGAVVWQKAALDQELVAVFQRAGDRLHADLLRRFNQPLSGLKGARGVYAASAEVSRASFRDFVDSRDMLGEFAGVRGFGFVARVPRAELDAFIGHERQDGAPDFDVQTTGTEEPLFVIKHIEPLANNRSALGLDLGQTPVPREAVTRAILSGAPALSGKLALLQDGAKTPGFLLLMPVYRNGADPITIAQRQAALRGLLYAPMVAADLLAGAASAADDLLRFSLEDQVGSGQDPYIYAEGDPAATNPMQSVRTLVFGGQFLTLKMESTAALAQSQDRSRIAILALAGSVGSFFLAFTAWLLSVGRLRAQRLADQKTAELDRMARVVQHTKNAVTLGDVHGRITWVNEGFTQLTGYTLEDARGKTPGELLGSGKTSPDVLEVLSTSALLGERCRVQVLNRAKDGHEYWVDTEVQPTRDAQGDLVGFMEIGTDITARVQDQQTLKALSDRMTLAIEGGSDGLWDWMDVTQDAQWWSPNYYTLLGYTPGELPATVTSHRSLIHPDYVESSRVAAAAALAGRGVYDVEVKLRTKSQGYRWFRIRAKVYFDAAGKATRKSGSTQDINDRKLAQAAVVKTSQRFALAADSAGIGVWDWDVQANTVGWDAQMYRIYHREATPNSRPMDILLESIHPDDKARFENALHQSVTSRAAFDGDYRIVWPDGEVRYIRAAAQATVDSSGRVTRLTGVNFDITQVKHAQMAQAESEAILDRAGRIAGVGGWSTKLGSGTLFWSDQTKRLHEVPLDYVPDLEGTLRFYAPQDRAVMERALELAAQTGHGWDLELHLTTAAGRSRWVRSVGEAEMDGDVPVALIGTFQDITERREHDEALRLALESAQHATEAAEEASRSKSQFVANMSHEIRTPMNAILGMLRLLQNTELTTRQLDYTQKTEGAARSLLGLLNDILDFSKVEAGKMTLDPRPFRLDTVLRDLSVILSANVGKKAVEVLFDVDPALPLDLVGDDMRLQQVLINLGGNAIKFTSQGEVILRLRQVHRSAQGVSIEFAMQDSGIGIAPENQAHIFTGFSQAEANTTRRFGGTGLGLAISSRLTTLLGGELSVQSTVGVGSTFSFQLQFDVPAPVTLTVPPTAVPPAVRTLVVDDNPVALGIMADMVQALGWPCDTADGGAVALQRVRAAQLAGQPYQLVLMDWLMPDMDGWQALADIHALAVTMTTKGASTPEAPLLVMVTASGREALSQRSVAEQALLHGFLVKPVTASVLRDTVHDALAARTTAASGRNPLVAKTAASPKRLLGLRLLLIEDNKINQMVAQGLLRQEGADVTLADDGQQGVEAVTRSRLPDAAAYDAVLMDIQMPVMDGYTATQTIRQQLSILDLPIIAMTANAMASDRAACLAVGMNDHVGKPFELDHLVATLLRYIARPALAQPELEPEQEAKSAPSPAPLALALPSASPDAPPAFDLEGALARLGGNTSMYATVLETFLQDLAPLPAAVTAHLVQGDTAAALRALHTLKGLAATVGAQALSREAAALELLCKSTLTPADQLAVRSRLDAAVALATDRLQPALQQYLGAVAGSPDSLAPALGSAAARQNLVLLRALLARSDMQALEVFELLRPSAYATLGPPWEALHTALNALAFGDALVACDTLLSLAP